MPFKALKPIKFDQGYFVGDIVPDEAVDPKRVADLEAMGLIMREKFAFDPALSNLTTPEAPVTPETPASKNRGRPKGQ